MCIHILNTFLFVSKKGMKEYPMMLYQACVNPYNSDFDSQLSMLMPNLGLSVENFLGVNSNKQGLGLGVKAHSRSGQSLQFPET